MISTMIAYMYTYWYFNKFLEVEKAGVVGMS